MTEDDTFLALLRPSGAEMYRNYIKWLRDPTDTDDYYGLCERHNWDGDEFDEVLNNIKGYD